MDTQTQIDLLMSLVKVLVKSCCWRKYYYSITSSSEVISEVVPFIKGNIASSSMTVPIPDGSTVDLTIDLAKESSIDEINNIYQSFPK